MEKLTEDVLINIFIRLPAKQLVQMRRVCKPWNAFLSESFFIKSHLNHSNKDNKIVLFFNPALFDGYRSTHDSEHVLPCTAYDLSQSPIIELNDLVKLPRNFPQSALNENGGHVIGSVNGLICFYIGYCDSDVQGIYIWNPSLSVVTTLPQFHDQQRKTDPYLYTGGYRYSFCFGFGFDPKTDDYKVVKLTEDYGDDDSDSDDEEQVEVYSMKKGSWEFMVDDSFPSDIVDGCLGMFVDDHDGHLHALCFYINKKGRKKTIVAFDFEESSFHRISLPDSIAYEDNVLGMLEGKICVISKSRDDGNLEVWVMNEYGVARDSWVKSHMLSKLNLESGKRKRKRKRRRPIGFTLNNKFLFADDSKGLLGCYDQETDKVTHFGSYTTAGISATVVPYVDSLVWYASPTN